MTSSSEMHGQGLRATGVAVVGWNAADTILEVARPERVAVIALATHGRGGLRRLVLGSVADKLVRGADVPVLVYRPHGTPQDEEAVREAGRSPPPSDRRGGEMMTYGGMGGLVLVYAILWILVVGTIVVALWRGMQAQEKMARHLEAIERALTQRSGAV